MSGFSSDLQAVALPKIRRALVVDDSKGWVDYHCERLQEVFGGGGAADPGIICDRAYSAKDGYDAVYEMISHPYDLIITDLHMESIFGEKYAGEWLVEQIQLLKQYANTKIVIISAAYNVKIIAENLNVQGFHKSIAARDDEIYKGF